MPVLGASIGPHTKYSEKERTPTVGGRSQSGVELMMECGIMLEWRWKATFNVDWRKEVVTRNEETTQTGTLLCQVMWEEKNEKTNKNDNNNNGNDDNYDVQYWEVYN